MLLLICKKGTEGAMCNPSKKGPFSLLEPLKGTQPRDNNLVGKNPLFLDGVQLEAAGIERTTPLKANRAHCIDCCGGNEAEVRRCVAVKCALWHLRMGTNRFQQRR